MSYIFETIAAISTPVGNGGIAIVRISGNNAIFVLDKIFKSNKKATEIKSHTINYGHIVDEQNIIVDEVLVNVMLAPKTYTKENIVEINCHGGIVSVSRILELVLKNGARMAETGEFTKRAFLNGRIDLSQAEAVIDIINAKTTLSQQNAVNQLEGKLSKIIKEIRNDILLMIANIEASIDYPEHDMEQLNFKTIYKKTSEIKNQIQELLKTSDKGKIIKEGIETVILGRPNVGKSSLLNTLLQEERAIVTDIAGTTRDILQEYVNILGIPLKLVDTAGIRETEDKIEKIGVEKAREFAKHCDLIIFMIDGSVEISKLDIDILKEVQLKKIIVLVNKTDLKQEASLELIKDYIDEDNIIKTSLTNKVGIEVLYDKIKELFFQGDISLSNDVLVSSLRNKNSINNSLLSLNQVIKTIDDKLPEDFISIDLQEAYKYLGEVTGESLDEDIIDKIFKEFCLGK